MDLRSPIIPVSAPPCHRQDWKSELKSAFSNIDNLLNYLDIDPLQVVGGIDKFPNFALRVPKSFVDRMQKGNPRDPLLLQVLSSAQENQKIPGFTTNPLQEHSANAAGLLHKYKGRVLLILAAACAINCRYCFRRHFDYHDNAASGQQLQQALTYIAGTKSITEVILSGGDPLMVDDHKLSELLTSLESIPHLKRLRIHSRLPVVIPSRVTSKLVTMLAKSRLKSSMVFHINHANEINQQLVEQLAPLRLAGTILLNQAVLLNNINDSAEAQIALSNKLFDSSILPYYLHLLDPVAGAAHFNVSQKRAIEIIATMRANLPGYLVPRLAREIPGRTAKTIIG